MRNGAPLMIHPARLEQLKRLGRSWEIKSTEVIEHLIFQAMKSGDLPDETPGIDLERSSDNGVIVGISGLAPMRLTAGEVQHLSGKLTWLPEPETAPGFDLKPVDGGRWFSARVGRGFVHAITDKNGNTAKLTATKGLLRDLARQLPNTALGISLHELTMMMAEAEAKASAA